MNFMTDGSWQAFTYPIEHSGGSNVSQVLSLVPPSDIRDYVLKCEAAQVGQGPNAQSRATNQSFSGRLNFEIDTILSLFSVLNLTI